MIDLQPYIAETNEVTAAPYDVKEKLHALKRILERLCRELTKEESMQFPNLFSRLVFIAQKHRLPKQLEWRLQHFRVRESVLRKNSTQQITNREYRDAVRTLSDLYHFLQTGSTNRDQAADTDGIPGFSPGRIRVYILKIASEDNQLLCVAENNPRSEIIVQYDISLDDNTTVDSVEAFWEGAQLNLIDCDVDKNGYFIPKHIVLEPDYLIDASAIAECFQEYAVSPLHYFRNKLEEKENRSYLLLGNLANVFSG